MTLTQIPQGMLSSDLQNATFGFKNRIINGAMTIAQRGTSAITTDGGYPVDRFVCYLGTSGAAYSLQQSSTAPAGFSKSLGITCTTAGTLNVGAYGGIRHSIEGFNTTDLNWGTVNAKPATLSFWVRSSLTGNYGVVVRASGGTYGYVAQYTINTANTWQQITLTIPAPTAGTWLTDNGIGVQLVWDLSAGTSYTQPAGSWISSASEILGLTGGVKVLTNLNATFNITGVQFEVGSTSTAFDYRAYSTELTLCQRYYQFDSNFGGAYVHLLSGGYAGTTGANFVKILVPEMRTTPTVGFSAGNTFLLDSNVAITPSSMSMPGWGTNKTLRISATLSGGPAGSYTTLAGALTGTALISYTAEI